MNDIVYKAPPPEPTVRRVYVLPRDLVQRVHDFGFQNGHPSEVSAVRDLLERALDAWEGPPSRKQESPMADIKALIERLSAAEGPDREKLANLLAAMDEARDAS